MLTVRETERKHASVIFSIDLTVGYNSEWEIFASFDLYTEKLLE